MKILAIVVVYFPDDFHKLQKLISVLSNYCKVCIVCNSPLNFKIHSDYIICNKKNLGTAGAYNLAIKFHGCEFDFYWLFDQDSELDDLTVGKFLESSSKIFDLNKISAACFEDSHNKRITTVPYSFNLVEKTKSSGLLFKSTLVHQVGSFDEDLFVDYVDWDFCYRIRSSGFFIAEIDVPLLSHQLGHLYPIFLGFFEVSAPSPTRLYLQRRSTFRLLRNKTFPFSQKLYLLLRIFSWPLYSLLFEDRFLRLKMLLKKN